MATIKTRYNFQHGFTLLEVLVAVFVLALGLLGFANLQTVGLRANQNAYLRTQAMILAYDIIDRMRSNMLVGDTNNDGKIDVYLDNYNSVAPQRIANCLTPNGCGPSEMVQYDLYEWQALIANTLPGGRATVCLDDIPATPQCDGGNSYVVRVEWNDANTGQPTQSLAISFGRLF